VAAHGLGEVYAAVEHSVVSIETEWGAADAGLREDSVAGSGVLVSAGGRVLTAAHVVQSAGRVWVVFADGERVPARLSASEPLADLALLQLARVPAQARPAPLGDSDATRVGDQVLVVAAPFGLPHSLSVGHLSGRRQAVDLKVGLAFGELLQTDAAVNEGSSGGPLFDLGGRVIGVVSHFFSADSGFQGVGFAVASNSARAFLAQPLSLWNGLDVYYLHQELAAALNLPQSGGLLVQGVAADSLAARLGLREGSLEAFLGDESLLLGGDIILSLQGVVLARPLAYPELSRRLRTLRGREPLTVTVLRGGRRLDLSAPLEATTRAPHP
jgi:S1-C subfamily serine protease